MTATLYRQTLTFDAKSAASRDIGALHRLVMSGYFRALEGGHDDARSRLDSLFLAQRPAPDTRRATYPPLARSAGKVLVQASAVGEWDNADPALGVTASDPIAVNLSVDEGDRVEVQTLANPMRSLASERDEDGRPIGRGKRVVVTQANDVADWFVRVMGKKGLALEPHAVTVGQAERLQGTRTKGGGRTALNVDVRLLRGSGIVTDPEAFTEMLTTGIGRGRPYGAGLVRHRRVG